eukprot:467778-Pelagomonas_calceolata.AAC.1
MTWWAVTEKEGEGKGGNQQGGEKEIGEMGGSRAKAVAHCILIPLDFAWTGIGKSGSFYISTATFRNKVPDSILPQPKQLLSGFPIKYHKKAYHRTKKCVALRGDCMLGTKYQFLALQGSVLSWNSTFERQLRK